MRYTVTWTAAAIARLTELWLNAPDRSAVTLASDHIDALLHIDPYAPSSESRDDHDRVMFVQPLGVLYSVSDADRLVTVRAVWRTD